MDVIEELLVELGKVTGDYQRRKNSYNIFQVLEIEHKEVIMCRFLADLLNPEGAHHRGIRYLKTFMRDVLLMDITEEQLTGSHVYKEYPIQEDRRIDIVIQNKEWFIPIEVKIHAGEQKSQCYDYYQFANQKDNNARVIYLTKWGTLPSEYSLKSANEEESLSENKVLCVSFAKDICDWLEKVLLQESGIMEQLIQQYLEAIHDFIGDMNRGLKMNITDKILKKEEYFRTALEIEASMKTAKSELIHKVLQEFERQMEPLLAQLGLEKELCFSWYEYQEQAREDFYNCYSTYPGINYVVKKVLLPEDLELWFRIEVEHNLFAGLCVFDPNAESEYGKGNQLDEVNEQLEAEVLKYLNMQTIQKGSWWLVWWYLPTGTDKCQVDARSVPNFKEMNEAAIRLVTEDNLQKFVKESIDVVENMLRQILK